MKSNNWAAALSLTVGLTALAGCGQAPVAAPKAPLAAPVPATAEGNFTGGLAAQEGVGAPAPTAATPAAAPATPANPAPAAPPDAGGGSGTPATTPGTTGGAPAVTPPAMPGPAMPGAMPPGAVPGAAPGAVPPGALPPGSGVLGDPRFGGVVGVISKSLDRGLGPFAFASGDLVAFQSNRAEGGGNNDCKDCKDHHNNFDIFIYDALAQTVLALPGVNTYANETNPRLSSSGQFLVYQTDENGSEDIRVFDLSTQLIDTLRTLNTTEFDEMEPDVSDDGNLIVYVSNESGYDNLRIYNTHNGANFIVPVANRGLNHITWPTISGNGDVIAYGASAGEEVDRQIYIYSLRAAAQLTPPFVNVGDADQYNPDLNETGDKIVFVSNRRGNEDIYMTDLRSGFTDNMVLANSDCREQEPRFLGLDGARIVFQSNRTGNYRIYAYDLPTALLDLLPVANEIGADTQLRNTHPRLPKFPSE